MTILFLDDDESRVKEFNNRTCFAGFTVHHVENGKDFCSAILSKKYDLIMLDHDLQDGDWTGTDAAKFLADNSDFLNYEQHVIVHSFNPIGVASMLDKMKHASHLRVSAIDWAWGKATVINGRLMFEF